MNTRRTGKLEDRLHGIKCIDNVFIDRPLHWDRSFVAGVFFDWTETKAHAHE
jgi:hypothetical protein